MSEPNPGSPWVELIYRAAEDPAQWNDFLYALVSRLQLGRAEIAIHYAHPAMGTAAALVGVTAAQMKEFYDIWRFQCPWTSSIQMAEVPAGDLRLSHELCSDEQLEQTEIYKQFLGPNGWHYGGGICLGSNGSQASFLTFNGPKHRGPIRPDERAFLESLVPHLLRAVRIQCDRERLRAERNLLDWYFDSAGAGILMVTELGRIVMANATAVEILERGAPLQRKDGYLRTCDSKQTQELLELVAEVGTPCGHDRSVLRKMILTRHSPYPPLMVIATPSTAGLIPQIGTDQPTATLHLIDPTIHPSADCSVLSQMFDLTPAESRIAGMLAAGLAMEEIAESLHVSLNTARTHVKRALQKTGSRRQAELVALVLRISNQSSAAQATG